MKNLFFVLLAAFFLASCAASKPPVGTYSENLSRYRITPEPPEKEETVQAVTEEEPEPEVLVVRPPENQEKILFDTLLSKKAEQVAYVSKAQGYRILLYSGRSANEADQVRQDFRNFTSLNQIEERPTRDYEQPNYKIRVGNFFTRLDAFYFLNKIREEFPSAIIVPEAIDLNALRRQYGVPIVERVYEDEESEEDEEKNE